MGGIDFSINRAVFYLALASALTISLMVWISRRMQQKPNRVQTAMELAYALTRKNITGGNLEQRERRGMDLARHLLDHHFRGAPM